MSNLDKDYKKEEAEKIKKARLLQWFFELGHYGNPALVISDYNYFSCDDCPFGTPSNPESYNHPMNMDTTENEFQCSLLGRDNYWGEYPDCINLYKEEITARIKEEMQEILDIAVELTEAAQLVFDSHASHHRPRVPTVKTLDGPLGKARKLFKARLEERKNARGNEEGRAGAGSFSV